ncbi:TonB-dependent receptor [Adhaeribacter sp. BT258]|uniref:TonB-dependent receptor n=1 Tax=Adhaeribacter terrigena TaxID=2793070 RepID=A0ABS1C0U7_9BACT|nr:TonB-dependent receptor [Adhaeribacter terrigena]MBK0403033.1 TonB-dependent receptor [Adhaeribacter terrigena]
MLPSFHVNARRGLLLLFFLISFFPSFAQNKFTISGYVRDSRTGEELIGASVAVKELPATGAVTNSYGFYSLSLPEGKYTLVAQYIGYEPNQKAILLNQNLKLDFGISGQERTLQEVEITSTRKNENVVQTQMGVEKLDMREINTIPVLMGERDVIKTLQLIPGIKSAGEGNGGFYVRGGSSDQNLILLDEAPVYNASHLLGFFSVFNSDAIKNVTVFKGGMPAEYGGRLSSVLDIKMNDGNNQKFGVSGGIGLISSRLSLEGPIVKDKGSFMISARRSYADIFLKLSSDSSIRDSQLYFYDINAKANYRLNENNRLYLSGYFGKDMLGFRKLFGFDWGNATGTLRWNHLFSEKMFSNTSLIYSNYYYNVNINAGTSKFNIISRINDLNLKQDFEYYPNARSIVKFGLNAIHHEIVPGAISAGESSSINSRKLPNRYSLENAAYVSHDYKFTENLNLAYGLRVSSFSVLGPGTFYTNNAEGEPIDTTVHGAGKFVKTYVVPEPRLALSYILSEVHSVKASYGRNAQYLHLLSNTTAGSPTDLWLPSGTFVKPGIADQVSLGYFRNFKDNHYEFSTEVYYKSLKNQLDYRDGAQLTFNENVEAELLIGEGRAYGVEFFLKKKYGKFNGWLGYTLSRSERQFDEINSGNYYPAKQDRTHDISIVGIYNLNEKWTFSSTFVYYTGNAITFPGGKYMINGRIENLYTERNAYRMPAYHRLDIGATWIRKKTEKFESSWSFSIYNVYGRENAYVIQFEPSETDPSRTEAKQVALFKMVPSFSYNFKF